MKNFFEKLSKSKLFDGISPSDAANMLDCMGAEVKSFSKGEYLMRAGDAPRALALVLSGGVHIVKADFWGNNFILTDANAGQTFAEASVISGEKELLFDAIAKEPTEALFIPADKIFGGCITSCGCHRRVLENLLGAVAAKNLIYERKCEHLSRRTTREKLLSFLSEQSTVCRSDEFTISYNRQQLADYLSVDRSAMSSELGKMQYEGLLEFSKNRFKLLKKETI